MHIIPAIDLLNKKVVKAFAGNRDEYKELFINSKDYSDPLVFIDLLVNKLKFKLIYIADLDAINDSGIKNWLFLKKIFQKFPQIFFWIDAGFSNLDEIIRFKNFINPTNNYLKIKVVVGTESFQKSEKTTKLPKYCIFSLDFNDSESEWLDSIKKKSEIILMFIKRVGGRGVDWEKMKWLENIIPISKCYIAGGIKNDLELEKIKKKGYKGVLVSTILHRKIKLGT